MGGVVRNTHELYCNVVVVCCGGGITDERSELGLFRGLLNFLEKKSPTL